MNKNLLFGLVIVVLVGVGIVLVVNMNNVPVTSPTATSTPSGATSTVVTPTPTPIPIPARQAGAPLVTTDSGATPSNSTVVVTGKVTPNGAQTSYWYEYGRTNSLGTRTSAQAIGSGYTQISAPAYITGLSANATYYFRLSAQNSFGTVNGATINFTTNNNPPPQGNAPTTRTDAATDLSNTTANLNGRANPNGSPTSYWFEYGDTNELGNTTAFQSAGEGSASVNASISITDLQPLTKYYFRMNAQNQFGTVNGAMVSFTTKGPPAAMAPSATTTAATAITSSGATLNGTVNPNNAETSYWFEYENGILGTVLGRSTAKEKVSAGASSVKVSMKITNLVTDTEYTYRLVTENSKGVTRGAAMTFRTKP